MRQDGRTVISVRTKKTVVAAVVAALSATTVGFGGSGEAAPRLATESLATPVYLDPAYTAVERATDLVSRLTLTEKFYQLATTNAPAIPRLGVQEYAYWGEAAHGISVMAGDYVNQLNGAGLITNGAGIKATSYPTALAAASTWNPDLIRAEGGQVSDEARGFLDPSLFGKSDNNLGPEAGKYGSAFYWSPTVNMMRDPRWGRSDDQYGEDPLLQGEMAGAYVEGMQGLDENGTQLDPYLKVAATAKHFALNNLDASRYSDSSDTTEANIRDYYTAQFERLIEKSGLAGLMTSYNAVNGVPTVANNFLLNVLARRTFGFDGYVTSDCGGVGTVYKTGASPVATMTGHDYAPPGWTTDHLGLTGTWTNAKTGVTVNAPGGAQAISLRAGNDLNCFGSTGQPDHPAINLLYSYGLLQSIENDPSFLQPALDAGILHEDVIDRALVHAFTVRMRTGEFDPTAAQRWNKLDKSQIESLPHREMAQTVGGESLVLLQNNAPAVAAAPLLPVDPSAVKSVVIVGDQANTAFLGGYSGSPTELISARQGIEAAVKAANPGATVTYDSCGTSTRLPGPAACLPTTTAAMLTADLVVVMVGTDMGTNGEGSDRSSLALAGSYQSLVDQVAAVGNKKVVLLDQSAGPVALDQMRSKVSSILFSSPNGQRQGAAAADVIFGKVNPSGHLPFTWFKDETQLPSIENYGLKPSETGGLGRTYQYFTGTPSYPFGYGLSYTSFDYSDVSVDRTTVNAAGRVTARVTVTNTGARPGADVVQLYATPPDAKAKELPYRLAGFAKTDVLAPGASQVVTMPVDVADTLRLWDPAAQHQYVPQGAWTFSVASAARTSIRDLPVTIQGTLPSRVKQVTVQPEELVLDPGQTVPLQARNAMSQDLGPTGLANDGSSIVMALGEDDSFQPAAAAAATYSSNRPSVATVDSRGVVTAVGPGVVTISATVQGVTGSTTFAVRGSSTTPPGSSGTPSTGSATAAPTPSATPPAAGGTATTTPASTRTRIRLPKPFQVRGVTRARMLFQVVSQTPSPTAVGKAVIRLDGRKVRSVPVRVSLKTGRSVNGLVYRPPTRLGVGRHVLRVTFKPSNASGYRASRSRAVKLTVSRLR